MTTQMSNTNGAVWCVAQPGFRPGQFVHPEGECACFRGGPAPIQSLTEADLVLAAAAGRTQAQHILAA